MSAFTVGARARCGSTELAQHLNVNTTFFKNSKPKFWHGVISQVQARNLVIEYLSGHNEPVYYYSTHVLKLAADIECLVGQMCYRGCFPFSAKFRELESV